MRRNRIRTSLVSLAVLATVLGLGTGRADAASPSQITRYARDFTVTLKVYGGGLNFSCTNIYSSWASQVAAPKGSTRTGGDRSFSCTSGTSKIQLNYRLQNSYTSSGYANGTHEQWVTLWNGNVGATCAVQSRGTQLLGWPNGNFSATWAYQRSYSSVDCGFGRMVTADASYSEGWSAP